MRAWIELWVRLKVVDLVAETAWLTLTEKLELGGDLSGLLRYSYWGMHADGASEEDILEEVDRVIRMDSAFTNQNKHLYKLMILDSHAADEGSGTGAAAGVPLKDTGFGGKGTGDSLSRGDLPLERDFSIREDDTERSAAREIFAFDCLVRERETGREDGFTNRLNSRLKGVTVSGLKAGEVWRILIRADSREEAAGKADGMVVTRSRREGLILNPHYQKLEFISSALLAAREGRT